MEINVIELDTKYTECALCNTVTPLNYSIPMYEGKIVDTEKTDEWAGMPVCAICYIKDGLKNGYVKAIKITTEAAKNCKIGTVIIAHNGPYTQVGTVTKIEPHERSGYWISYEWTTNGKKNSATKRHISLSLPKI